VIINRWRRKKKDGELKGLRESENTKITYTSRSKIILRHLTSRLERNNSSFCYFGLVGRKEVQGA
jgi:hypothetical protein